MNDNHDTQSCPVIPIRRGPPPVPPPERERPASRSGEHEVLPRDLWERCVRQNTDAAFLAFREAVAATSEYEREEFRGVALELVARVAEAFVEFESLP